MRIENIQPSLERKPYQGYNLFEISSVITNCIWFMKKIQLGHTLLLLSTKESPRRNFCWLRTCFMSISVHFISFTDSIFKIFLARQTSVGVNHYSVRYSLTLGVESFHPKVGSQVKSLSLYDYFYISCFNKCPQRNRHQWQNLSLHSSKEKRRIVWNHSSYRKRRICTDDVQVENQIKTLQQTLPTYLCTRKSSVPSFKCSLL